MTDRNQSPHNQNLRDQDGQSQDWWIMSQSTDKIDWQGLWLAISRGDLKAHHLIYNCADHQWKRADDWPAVRALFERRDQLLSQAMIFDFNKVWVVSHAGRLDGPFSTAEVRGLIAKKALSASDLAWRSGWQSWQPIEGVVDFISAQGSIRVLNVLFLLVLSFGLGWLAMRDFSSDQVQSSIANRQQQASAKSEEGVELMTLDEAVDRYRESCKDTCRVLLIGKSGQVLDRLAFHGYRLWSGTRHLDDDFRDVPLGTYEVEIDSENQKQEQKQVHRRVFFQWRNLGGMLEDEFRAALAEHRKQISFDQQTERFALLKVIDSIESAVSIDENTKAYLAEVQSKLSDSKDIELAFASIWVRLSPQIDAILKGGRTPSSVIEEPKRLFHEAATINFFDGDINGDINDDANGDSGGSTEESELQN